MSDQTKNVPTGKTIDEKIADIRTIDTAPPIHTAQGDTMASRAPAHVTRPVVESPTSGVEFIGNRLEDSPDARVRALDATERAGVAPPSISPTFKMSSTGEVLNHRLYVQEDPAKDYFFNTKVDKYGAARHYARGYTMERDAQNAIIQVAGMILCSRPKEVGVAEHAASEAEVVRQRRSAQPPAIIAQHGPTVVGRETSVLETI